MIIINGPPEDRRCECCGRHITELQPFGKEGDPLVGNFEGALLVKTFRAMAPRDMIAERKLKTLKTSEDWEELEKEDKKEFENLSFYDQLRSTVEASWECRDCIILDDSDIKYWQIKLKGGMENGSRILC